MLTPEELNRVVESIRAAEGRTSAEIRVCIAKKCKENPLDAAYKKFKQLKMDTTALRNSVLIYVAPYNHKAAVVGDSGIDEAAQEGFWDSVLEEMFSFFKNGRICEGICRGVGKVGELVNSRYPVSENDVNELCDDVIWDEE
ncbi:TPM domain-containing protein [Petrimonas sulfuriphila]|uniref:TPM domain-containing protein n=1 Tax=Petrimonas sulfuriphila TaxID=285070 RepID=UPI00324B67FA